VIAQVRSLSDALTSPRVLKAAERWTLDGLRQACERKQIVYKENPLYHTIRGLVVTCGQTAIISLRASLPEREKIFACAQQLGLLALSRTPSTARLEAPNRTSQLMGRRYVGDWVTMPHEDERAEAALHKESEIWAAHLLMDRLLVTAQAATDAGIRQVAVAESETYNHTTERIAETLNIPPQSVALWLETQAHVFRVPPPAWLALTHGWWVFGVGEVV
jgi:hypothetical protein